MNQLQTSLDNTLQVVSDLAEYQRQSQVKIEQSQAEIQRIWEYLLNQSTNGNSNGGMQN